MEAYAWLSIAEAQDVEDATRLKTSVASGMTHAELDKARALAEQYWEDYVVPFR